MRRLRAGLRLVIAALIVIGLGFYARELERSMLYGAGPLDRATSLVIARGYTTEEIARRLESAAIVSRWQFFVLADQVLDRGRPLHAGEYGFTPGQSLHEVLRQLRDGRTVVHHLTVPEGLTVAEILGLIADEPALSGPLGPPPPEGSLMPDTYNFSLADSRAEMVARMRRAMDKALAEAWAGRDPSVPLPTPESALILASIVEKETGVAEERPKVAAVFLNRLRVGMKLQADPTLIYALTAGKASLGRPLAHADLAIDSPFNSYRYDGLPPTPIACPGRSALAAVLHAETTDALYFVADGSGRHVFAQSLEDHNRNVARLRQMERAVPGGVN
jgi:UPF0755 protein